MHAIIKLRLTRYLYGLMLMVFIFFIARTSFAELNNNKSLGILLGDPIAVTFQIPVKKKTFINIHAGIWTWSFWHDIKYDTPFLSVDYAVRVLIKQIPLLSYIGTGFSFFFADNPKDDNNYDACVAVRIPFGFEFYKKENFSIGFEIAPIYQFLPAYSAKPYGLELNGGVLLNYSY